MLLERTVLTELQVYEVKMVLMAPLVFKDPWDQQALLASLVIRNSILNLCIDFNTIPFNKIQELLVHLERMATTAAPAQLDLLDLKANIIFCCKF